MARAKRLSEEKKIPSSVVTFGVCATCDPRVDRPARQRSVNIVEMVADTVAKDVRMPDWTPVDVVWTPDRPKPLLHLINGGEDTAKSLRS